MKLHLAAAHADHCADLAEDAAFRFEQSAYAQPSTENVVLQPWIYLFSASNGCGLIT
jgi:hypothetical protein